MLPLISRLFPANTNHNLQDGKPEGSTGYTKVIYLVETIGRGAGLFVFNITERGLWKFNLKTFKIFKILKS